VLSPMSATVSPDATGTTSGNMITGSGHGSTNTAGSAHTGPTEPKSRHSNNQNTNTTTTTGDHAGAHDTEPSELEGCRRITMSEIGDLPRHQIVRRESVHVQQLTRDPR
jgi:hypothetical protein